MQRPGDCLAEHSNAGFTSRPKLYFVSMLWAEIQEGQTSSAGLRLKASLRPLCVDSSHFGTVRVS